MLTRTTMVAVTGVAAAAATVIVAPAAAYAAPAGAADAPVAAATDPPCNAVAHLKVSGGAVYAPVTNLGGPSCRLGFGDRGTPVVKVQAAVEMCYGESVGPSGRDGIFGQDTQTAVAHVRARKGLGNPQEYNGALVRAGFLYPVFDGDNNFLGRCDTPFT
jgi:hypothetical protein